MQENALIIIALASTLSSLITEAIKNIVGSDNIDIRNEVLAAIVSVVTSILVCVAHIILNNVVITPKEIVYCVILVVMTILSSSLGYDKVTSVLGKIFGQIE